MNRFALKLLHTLLFYGRLKVDKRAVANSITRKGWSPAIARAAVTVIFTASCGMAADQWTQAPTSKRPEEKTGLTQTLPAAPPPLSKRAAQFLLSHPERWHQFLSRPQIRPVAAKPQVTLPSAEATVSRWYALARNAPAAGLHAPLLLTDGSVLVHQYCTRNWYKLTPDINGSYLNGTWSQIAQMPSGYAPLYFAAATLSDGRLIINGGMYNDDGSGCKMVWTNGGAIYYPGANAWAPVPPPIGWTTIGDAPSVVLADGTYMMANCCWPQVALLNPDEKTWTATGYGKFGGYGEESWTLLPNGNLLTVDSYEFTGGCGRNSETYAPSTGKWITAGNSPVQLSDCAGAYQSYELGPQILRPDGAVVAFSGITGGGVAGSAIYNASNRTWASGPNLPAISGQNYNLADGAATWLPNGNILLAASPGFHSPPTHFFELTPGNTLFQVADASNASNESSYWINFLILPTGNILKTDFSSTVEIYLPSGNPNPSWAPVITSVPTILVRGQTYAIAGLQLNGLTEGSVYDDDQKSATNFPLVRIQNKITGHIFYARTFAFSTRSVAPGTFSSANFTVPLNIEPGMSSLVAVANGIPSAEVPVTLK